MSLETTECNNNALNHRHYQPEREPSEGQYFQDQMPEYIGCKPPQRKAGSISSVDRQMIRYFKSMLPRLPLKYVHFCSPKRRSLPHVLHSKMRLRHYGRNESISLLSDQTACTSNASCSTRDNKTRYSFWTQICTCCCSQLDTRPENSIVHMATASDLPVATVIAIRVQMARRIQSLDSVQGSSLTQVDPPLSPLSPSQSLVHASGKLLNSQHLRRRQEVGQQPAVISFTGEGRVEVLPLLTAQAGQRRASPYTSQSSQRKDARLPESPTQAKSTISGLPPRPFRSARPGGGTQAGRSPATTGGIISSSSSSFSYMPVTRLCDHEVSIRPSDMSYSSTHASGSGDCIWGSRTQELDLFVAPAHSNHGRVENAIAAERKLPDRVVRQAAWNDCQRVLSRSSTSSN